MVNTFGRYDAMDLFICDVCGEASDRDEMVTDGILRLCQECNIKINEGEEDVKLDKDFA